MKGIVAGFGIIARCAIDWFTGKLPLGTVAFTSKYKIDAYRQDGTLAWSDEFHNLVVNQGLNAILDIMFHATAAISPWYLGLTTGTPVFAAADTMASHAGWTEYTNYSEATRVEWAEDAASGQSITNTTTSNFTISGSGGTIGGVFLTSNNTKGGATGTLWGGAAFSGGNQAVVAGFVVKVTATIPAQSL